MLKPRSLANSTTKIEGLAKIWWPFITEKKYRNKSVVWKSIFLWASCASLKWMQVRKQTPHSSRTSAAYCFLSLFEFWVFRRASGSMYSHFLAVCCGRQPYPMRCMEFIQKMEWISTSFSLPFVHTLNQKFGSSYKIPMNHGVWFIY